MTDAAAAPATAELEPVLTGALALLTADPNASLEELSALVVTAPAAPLAAEAQPFPDLPRHVVLTPEVRRALVKLADVFNSVEIEKRRSLTQAEIDLLTIEQGILGMIGATMAARMEAVKETIRVHMDVAAEEAGIAVAKDQLGPGGEVIVKATPRDQKGHYLLAGEKNPHRVQAGPMSWSQERSAATPAASDGVLQKAYREGEIDRADYLAVTREVRVLDPIRTRDFIRQAPARGLRVLRKITVAGRPSASLYLRKNT